MPQMRLKLGWIPLDELAIGNAPRAERHLDYVEAKKTKSELSLSSHIKTPLPEHI